jgi:segregation and condensation protein B
MSDEQKRDGDPAEKQLQAEADLKWEGSEAACEQPEEQIADEANISSAARETEEELIVGTPAEAKAILECALFTTNDALPLPRLSKLLSNMDSKTLRALIQELQHEYEARQSGLQIVEVAGGYQLATRPGLAPWILRLHHHRTRNPLTPAALETIAIIAYKQPITRAETEAIRGVDSSGIIRNLVELGLVEVVGKKDVVGYPMLYGTTNLFLKTFGLKCLSDLPSIQELKEMFKIK